MSDGSMPAAALPGWVSGEVRRYLAHTVAGQSIRTLARAAGVHASTISRQVRRIEARRDDLLVDRALILLGGTKSKESDAMTQTDQQPDTLPDPATLAREGCRVLRRLCETGAVLAVAEQMEKAVVVRDCGAEGAGARTAAVDRAIAEAMALQDWIACSAPGRISRYRITAAGRAALNRMMAEGENRARSHLDGMAEVPVHPLAADCAASVSRPRRTRYGATESPLAALARRRDKEGRPFLDPELVQAGERLREDFELAQMGPQVTQNWDRFLTGGTGGGPAPGGGRDSSALARERLQGALAHLGPGLGDVALRCCCYLEGLEAAEKRMGWSARSGKIVLRIALQRLSRYYESLKAPDRMIG